MFPVDDRSPALTSTLEDRLNQVHARMKNSAENSGRLAADVRLVVVTKTIDSEVISKALAAGVTEIGENKVQEAGGKQDSLVRVTGQSLTQHLLGALQTNKARKAVELFDMIQSVDRPKLASFLDRAAGECGKKQSCLVEVKVSDEATKTGIPYSEAEEFIRSFHTVPNLKLEGLMTIAPFDQPEEETRACFRQFHEFFEAQKKFLGDAPILSMGMTDDFEIAIEEGATMVRIGRAIFGERTL